MDGAHSVLTSKSDRERCHGCGSIVYIAPISDPHRRVLCARCAAESPDDVEDLGPMEDTPDGLEDTGQAVPHRWQTIPKPKT